MTQILVTSGLIIWLVYLVFIWIRNFINGYDEEAVILTVLWWVAVFIYATIY